MSSSDKSDETRQEERHEEDQLEPSSMTNQETRVKEIPEDSDESDQARQKRKVWISFSLFLSLSLFLLELIDHQSLTMDFPLCACLGTQQEKVQQRREEVRRRTEESSLGQGQPSSMQSSLQSRIGTPSVADIATKPKVREDLVSACVNFLCNPKVKASPQSQKIAFMKQKGLTQEEIQESLRRAGDR